VSRDQSVEDEQLDENEPEDQDGDLVGPPETTCRPDHNPPQHIVICGINTFPDVFVCLFLRENVERSLLLLL